MPLLSTDKYYLAHLEETGKSNVRNVFHSVFNEILAVITPFDYIYLKANNEIYAEYGKPDRNLSIRTEVYFKTKEDLDLNTLFIKR